jgi:hypothetical protein
MTKQNKMKQTTMLLKTFLKLTKKTNIPIYVFVVMYISSINYICMLSA